MPNAYPHFEYGYFHDEEEKYIWFFIYTHREACMEQIEFGFSYTDVEKRALEENVFDVSYIFIEKPVNKAKYMRFFVFIHRKPTYEQMQEGFVKIRRCFLSCI